MDVSPVLMLALDLGDDLSDKLDGQLPHLVAEGRDEQVIADDVDELGVGRYDDLAVLPPQFNDSLAERIACPRQFHHSFTFHPRLRALREPAQALRRSEALRETLYCSP